MYTTVAFAWIMLVLGVSLLIVWASHGGSFI